MNAFGIDIRGGSGLLVRTFLQKSDGTILTSGNSNVYIEEYQNDGTFKSYDFNDKTFKTGALTTPYAALTHRKGNNGTRDTGIWTYMHANTSGFTEGNIYVIQTSSDYASPQWQSRELQYGSGEFASVVYINPSSLNSIADTTLGRDFSAVNSPASRSLLQSARFLRNNWYTSGNPPYLYITQENDSTIAWSGALSITNGGSGITGMDPF